MTFVNSKFPWDPELYSYDPLIHFILKISLIQRAAFAIYLSFMQLVWICVCLFSSKLWLVFSTAGRYSRLPDVCPTALQSFSWLWCMFHRCFLLSTLSSFFSWGCNHLLSSCAFRKILYVSCLLLLDLLFWAGTVSPFPVTYFSTSIFVWAVILIKIFF